MKGVTIAYGWETYFYPTESTRRTDKLARSVATAILRHFGVDKEPYNDTVQFVKDGMQYAELFRTTLPNGKEWLRIVSYNSTFSAPADDPTIVILKEVA